MPHTVRLALITFVVAALGGATLESVMPIHIGHVHHPLAEGLFTGSLAAAIVVLLSLGRRR